MTLVTEFFNDLRYGARLLRRSFGFTLVAVLSLGLGIGGATAVFSLVNAIVLRMLPVPDPQQLYQVDVSRRGQDYGQLFSAPTFQAARDQVAGRNVQLVSGEYFSALRQRPQLGRLFTGADNRVVGEHPVAVVSDTYWKRRL